MTAAPVSISWAFTNGARSIRVTPSLSPSAFWRASIDSPGSRALPRNQNRPDLQINPVKIAEAFYYLHTQDKSCWTHELQLTPFPTKPSF